MSAAARDGPCTYFIQCSSPPLVKIGTTEKIRKRLKKFRTLNPFIVILGISRTITEEEAHQMFAENRCGMSEWFRNPTAIREFLSHQMTEEERKETEYWNQKIAGYREKEGLP
jgi:hypothetical protein